MSARTPPHAGLVHLGLHYETPDELAAVVGPHVRAALDEGQTAYAIVDGAAEAALRSLLGPLAGRIRFLASSSMGGTTPQSFLSTLRTCCASGRRTLVVGQYSVVEATEGDCALREDGINLVLGDLPLTLLCASSSTDGPGRTATAWRTHPGWITHRAASRNPGYRPPADRSRTSAGMWGRLVLRTSFRGLADLARVRHEVIELVCEMGLRGTDADAAVLAAHETAALACRSGNDTGAPVEPDTAERTVEVRATASSLFFQVSAPGPVNADRHADAHTVLGATVSDTDMLRPLTWFCHRASVHDHARTRTIRVLVDRRRPLAYRLPVA